MFRSERGLCPRHRFLGEVSEGAAEAPSEETPQMSPYHRPRYVSPPVNMSSRGGEKMSMTSVSSGK